MINVTMRIEQFHRLKSVFSNEFGQFLLLRTVVATWINYDTFPGFVGKDVTILGKRVKGEDVYTNHLTKVMFPVPRSRFCKQEKDPCREPETGNF